MGAVWLNRVYATSIHNCGDLDLIIIHLEMLNIVIALRTWGTWWCHSNIKIFCDNLGVVQVIRTGKTRDSFLSLCIQLHIFHIAGVHNVIADTLSRIYSDKPVNLDLMDTLRSEYVWDNIPSHYFDLNMEL